MPKAVSALELSLGSRHPEESLTDWLYRDLRGAILEGRLPTGTRLPASRDFARQHAVSRGTVVTVFERLQSEGYLASRTGAGTWVRFSVTPDTRPLSPTSGSPAYVNRLRAEYRRPKAFEGLQVSRQSRPFQMGHPALTDFPSKIWANLAARRVRTFGAWIQIPDDGRGYAPLREAITHYLAQSRGVRCAPEQVMLVSGVQQALDILSRLLLKPGDPVWMEDPGYFGATIAFENVGAHIIPVPVDASGLAVAAGKKLCAHARGVYVTPAHQFPLGMSMPLDRRMQLLDWARRAGAFIIEDDYDSEYRFEGRPIPALQSLDRHSSVIMIGSFNKLLFSSLRLGYVVLPPPLVDLFVAFRYRSDLHSVHLDHAVLCDFIAGGHFGRHLRRMRDLYASRLEELLHSGRKYLKGLLQVSGIQAGLYTAAFLKNGMSSREAESLAAAHGIDSMALDRFTFEAEDPQGILLGFAAFDNAAIRKAVMRLATALSRRV